MADFITVACRLSIGKDMVSGFQRCRYAKLVAMLNRIFVTSLALSLLAIFGDTSFGDSLTGSVPSKSPAGITQESVCLEKREVSLLENKAYFDALLGKINGARSEILISMYIFKTTSKEKSAANKIKDALVKAAKRGVQVKVLLEVEGGRSSSLNKENRYTAAALTRGGVKVYFDSLGKRTHTKVIVIDNRYTFIGSHNLTTGALHYNNELSLMIDSEDVAKETARYIEEIIALKKS